MRKIFFSVFYGTPYLVMLRKKFLLKTKAASYKKFPGVIMVTLVNPRTWVNTLYNKCSSILGIKEFPKDVFTQQQRRYGAVLLHVFLVGL